MSQPGTIKFAVRDAYNAVERAELRRQLAALGFSDASDPVDAGAEPECDLLILHRNTDGPNQARGVRPETVERLLQRGGVYVEYSCSNKRWRLERDRHAYGSQRELVRRLQRVAKPADLDRVWSVLAETAPVEEPLLPALSILCQGYLIAHADEAGKPAAEIEDEDRDAAVECGEALKKMGWTELCEAEESSRSQLMRELQVERARVRQARSWREVLGKERPPHRVLAREAGGADLAAVEELLELIYGKPAHAVLAGPGPAPVGAGSGSAVAGAGDEVGNDIPPGEVARAYLALYRAMPLVEVDA